MRFNEYFVQHILNIYIIPKGIEPLYHKLKFSNPFIFPT